MAKPVNAASLPGVILCDLMPKEELLHKLVHKRVLSLDDARFVVENARHKALKLAVEQDPTGHDLTDYINSLMDGIGKAIHADD
jgi:hypothetical protein